MVQWYPGHMEKAKRDIQSKLKLVDIVFELVDARVPKSSQNPMMNEIIDNKPKLVLMTKSTMADSKLNQLWINQFENALLIDAITGFNINKIVPASREVLKDKLLRDKQRGMKPRAIRAMVIGIPNVGKSTLINRLVNKKVTNVGNRPGITKAQQWIRINKDLELLDNPGILWSKFADEKQGFHLALTGAIKDQIYHKDDVILYFLDFLKKYYPKNLNDRYQLDNINDNIEILNAIGKSRGLVRNNEVEYERVYEVILNDFRKNHLGLITLDRVNE